MKQFSQKNQDLKFLDQTKLRKALIIKKLSENSVTLYKILLILVLHIFLALIIRQYNFVGNLYCISVIGIGFYIAISKNNLEKIAYVCAYIAGAEILWRMTGGSIFWEIGKFSTIAILTITLLKMKRPKVPVVLLFYFILLLPSVLITVQEESTSVARNQFSFYLSGPLAIFMSAWFFSSLKITSVVFQKILLAFIAPVIGIASLTLYGILTATNIVFNTESNFATSGGFGPNQVGVILGLGALFAFYFLLIPAKSSAIKIFFGGALLLLATLSLITFSRSGVILLLSSVFVSVVFLLQSQGKRSGIYAIVLLAGIAAVLIFPMIDNYTDQMLSKRYAEQSTTKRSDLANEEFTTWTDNPIFGVGIGQMRNLRDENEGIAAHTEFTRVLAEHGAFGLFSVLALLITAVVNVIYSENPLSRVFKASFVCWVLLFMSGNALRTVAPAFIFGLTFATFFIYQKGSFVGLKSIFAKDKLNKFRLQQSS